MNATILCSKRTSIVFVCIPELEIWSNSFSNYETIDVM